MKGVSYVAYGLVAGEVEAVDRYVVGSFVRRLMRPFIAGIVLRCLCRYVLS